MARTKKQVSTKPTRKMKPGETPETREKQLISLAIDLVEQRLIDGTASAQETTHFLKLASSDYKLKIQRLEKENKLLEARAEQIESQKRSEEMYAEALKAMRNYGGHGNLNEDADDEDFY